MKRFPLPPHALLDPSAIAVAFSFLVLIPSAGEAHQYWLTPSRYRVEAGETVELGAAVGTGFRGRAVAWNPDRRVRLSARSKAALDLSREPASDERVWIRLRPIDAGGTMVAFESKFRPIELPAAEFGHYLRDEGLDEVLRARRNTPDLPGRERYRRCAKLWLTGDDASRATEPVGLPLEIVPLSAPGTGENLSVRVLADGSPTRGLLVKAWNRPLQASGIPLDPEARDSVGVVWWGRTDERGTVTIPLRRAGEWLVSAVRMEPSSDPDEADWQSTWASLTFERRESAAPAPSTASRARP